MGSAMSPPALPDPATAESPPDDLAEAGVYRTAAIGFEHGLVALAAGWAFWLLPDERGYRLMVEQEAVADVREQLARFDRESVGWPPRPIAEATTRKSGALFTPLLCVLAALAVFWAQGRWPALTELGAVDATGIFARGEIWRPATALFLHGDAGHLASNVFSGLGVFAAVLMTMGRWRGWSLIASAAVAGNFAAAAIHYPGEYRSLGASTAIFAALGLLTGRAVRVIARANFAGRWRAMAVPLAAGLAVLGLYGAGGVEVDVLAHATGFACGLGLGFIFAMKRTTRAEVES